MLFNSIDFLAFFLIFFCLYWFVFKNNLKGQNLLVLTGSYFFYACWDWRFLFLLIGSSVLNFFLGILIDGTGNENRKKLYIFLSILQGIGGLVLFKYYDFFIDSFVHLFSLAGISLSIRSLNLVLPLGISFYTFRTISYVLDVNNEKIKPTRDWVVFFSYVSFFPSLISGPIDRASLLIPQLERVRQFNQSKAVDGLRQILWGLFKKIVIADSCAPITNQIFDSYQVLPASSLVLGTFLVTVQVYADFSGYSDMAIGFSRLIGFNITRNFNFPFFSRNIAEFWQKWHISLTSWMTDYVFTPLNFAFKKYGRFGLILAIYINLIVVGLWHGANWKFLFFGFLHGCYFVPLVLNKTINNKRVIAENKFLPTINEFFNMLLTFMLVMFTNVFFMAADITQGIDYLSGVFSFSIFSFPDIPHNRFNTLVALAFIFILFFVEWLQRDKQHGLQLDRVKKPVVRWAIYYSLLFCIYYFSSGSTAQFIYFQF